MSDKLDTMEDFTEKLLHDFTGRLYEIAGELNYVLNPNQTDRYNFKTEEEYYNEIYKMNDLLYDLQIKLNLFNDSASE